MPKRGHNWGEPIISGAEDAEERLGQQKTKILRFRKKILQPSIGVLNMGGREGNALNIPLRLLPPTGRPPHLRRNFVVILGKMDMLAPK